MKKHFRLATYNMCFGMRSDTILRAYRTSWGVVHGNKSAEYIESRIDLAPVLEAIREAEPDILILNEVFDSLTAVPLQAKLSELGFRSVYVGNSGHHEKPLIISTIVATKAESEPASHSFAFAKGMPGSGGGAAAVYIPELDLYILGCHLAFKKKYISDQIRQLDELYANLSKTGSAIIFAGDFNRTPAFFRKTSEFGRSMRNAVTERTFPSFFPWYGPFRFLSENIVMGPVDNAYYEGVEAVGEKTLKLQSDHKMAIADFQKN